MRAFDVIVFDYDGTLFDTRPAIVHCMRATFAAAGRAIPAAQAVAAAVATGSPLPEALIALDGSLRGERATLTGLVKTYRAIYAEQSAAYVQPFAGASRALETLHQDGFRCLIASNKGNAAIRRSLDEYCIARLIDLVLGDAAGVPRKPDPAILTEHILPRYAPLRRERLLIVGDTETDLLFANAAGVAACWAAYGYGDATRCRGLAPAYEISSLDELTALVRGCR